MSWFPRSMRDRGAPWPRARARAGRPRSRPGRAASLRARGGGAESRGRVALGTVTLPLCSRTNASPFWIILLLSLGVLEHGMIDAAFPPLAGLLDSQRWIAPSHGENRGSNPLGSSNGFKGLSEHFSGQEGPTKDWPKIGLGGFRALAASMTSGSAK